MGETGDRGGMAKFIGLGQHFFDPIQKYGEPIMVLLMRIMIVRVFFLSGLGKIRDWDNTILLFQYEYAVPVLSPQLAAGLATACELGLPMLILFGFLTRFAVIPLFVMALVIQFVLGAANPAFSSIQHYFWMIFLGFLFVRGAGPISVDHWLAGRLGPR